MIYHYPKGLIVVFGHREFYESNTFKTIDFPGDNIITLYNEIVFYRTITLSIYQTITTADGLRSSSPFYEYLSHFIKNPNYF